jgi:DNA-binding NarL/FixJ family response regulator
LCGRSVGLNFGDHAVKTSPMKIAVGIVDDKSQNLHLFAERLNYSDDIAIVLTAGGGNDFLDQMKKLPISSHPMVILMDIGMPDMDGIETVRVAKLLYSHIHFLMLTVFDDDDKLFEAIKAGADGYLLKNDKLASIIDCIVQLSETPEMEHEAPEKKDYALSDRETEILKLTVDGYPAKAIAEKLFLSSHTVRKHISNIYTKLHVSSKAQAIKIATKDKLI